MKVLQLANGYYKTGIYRHLFSAQEALGIENVVFVPIAQHETLTPSSLPNVHTFKCFNTLDRFLFFSKQAKMLELIESRLAPSSCDLIHAHTVFSGGYAAYKLHQKYGTPYMVAVRDTDVNTFFKRMPHLRSTGIQILRQAERIVFLSEVYQRRLLERYIPKADHDAILRKSLIIPNGISEIFFDNKGEARLSPGNPLRLIAVGELIKRKNPETVVRAAELLQAAGTPVTLTFVGALTDQSYQPMLQRHPWIVHHERCPQTEVIRHLREADLLVMPSHTETFGLVYAEAMSQGLPVLYTKGQGFDGQLPDGEVGYAVSDRNPQDVADKILLAKKNYTRLSENCVKDFTRFHWPDIAGIYLQVYRELARR